MRGGATSPRRFQALLGQDLSEQRHGREADAAVPQRRLEARKPPQDAHRPDAPAGRALAQVQRAEAVVPQRPEAERQIRLAAIERVEVEEEVDLHAPLVAGELVEAVRQGDTCSG